MVLDLWFCGRGFAGFGVKYGLDFTSLFGVFVILYWVFLGFGFVDFGAFGVFGCFWYILVYLDSLQCFTVLGV